MLFLKSRDLACLAFSFLPWHQRNAWQKECANDRDRNLPCLLAQTTKQVSLDTFIACLLSQHRDVFAWLRFDSQHLNMCDNVSPLLTPDDTVYLLRVLPIHHVGDVIAELIKKPPMNKPVFDCFWNMLSVEQKKDHIKMFVTRRKFDVIEHVIDDCNMDLIVKNITFCWPLAIWEHVFAKYSAQKVLQIVSNLGISSDTCKETILHCINCHLLPKMHFQQYFQQVFSGNSYEMLSLFWGGDINWIKEALHVNQSLMDDSLHFVLDHAPQFLTLNHILTPDVTLCFSITNHVILEKILTRTSINTEKLMRLYSSEVLFLEPQQNSIWTCLLNTRSEKTVRKLLMKHLNNSSELNDERLWSGKDPLLTVSVMLAKKIWDENQNVWDFLLAHNAFDDYYWTTNNLKTLVRNDWRMLDSVWQNTRFWVAKHQMLIEWACSYQCDALLRFLVSKNIAFRMVDLVQYFPILFNSLAPEVLSNVFVSKFLIDLSINDMIRMYTKIDQDHDAKYALLWSLRPLTHTELRQMFFDMPYSVKLFFWNRQMLTGDDLCQCTDHTNCTYMSMDTDTQKFIATVHFDVDLKHHTLR